MNDYKQISIREVPSYYWNEGQTITTENGEVLPWYEAVQKYPNLGIWVNEEGRPATKKELTNYARSFYTQDQLDKADAEEIRQKKADKYINAVSPNVMDILNIGSIGFLNRLSPTLNIGLIIDTFQGDNFIHSWLGNSGIVSDNFELTHPYWSLAINGAVDYSKDHNVGILNNKPVIFDAIIDLSLNPFEYITRNFNFNFNRSILLTLSGQYGLYYNSKNNPLLNYVEP